MKTAPLLAVGLLATAAIAQSNCFNSPPTGTLIGNAQDTIYPPQSIGFAFPLAGTTYTDIHVSDHGLAFLSNGGVPTPPPATPFVYTPSLANFSSGGPILAALWSDTIGGGTTTNAGVYIASSSTSCRIEWRDVASFGFPTPVFSLAMTLFPNGQIQFDYGPGVTNNSTFGGLSDNGIAGVFAGGALPAGVDLSAGGASANPSTFENWVTANTFDLASNRLLMVPTNPGWTFLTLGSATCASSWDYGAGCGGDPTDSVYEAFTSASFDLTARSFRWLRTGAGYLLTQAPATFVPPTASASPVATGQLDGQQQFTLSAAMPVPGGTTTTLNVTTKGQVELNGAPQAFVDFTPSAAELLDWPSAAFHCWHDFDQTAPGGGTVKFEEVGGVAYATWDGVQSFSSTAATTMQWQFELATGNVALVIAGAGGIGDPLNPDATVVGYSVGGVSVDPGATDLSAFVGGLLLSDTPPVVGALSLTASGAPTIGNAAFGYSVGNVPSLLPFAFVFFGTAPVTPGVDLTFLGMPGCFSHTTADIASVTLPSAGNAASLTLPIPANTGLAGLSFAAQAAAFSLATPLNLITSNGTIANVGF